MIETNNIFMQRFFYTLNTFKEKLYMESAVLETITNSFEIESNTNIQEMEINTTSFDIESNTNSLAIEINTISTNLEAQC
jgi:hypothetical protein